MASLGMLTLVLTLALASVASAQTLAGSAPVGEEFRANTQTTLDQRYPSVAVDADGDSVVAWDSWGQDGDGYGVYAQRYDASGDPVGGEFRVNTHTAGLQFGPSVAMDDDGDFLVVWTSSGQDGSGYGVYAQRFGASGNAVGAEFRANTRTAGSQELPSAAMDADGDFLVAWEGANEDGVYAQRYGASGEAAGGEFRANTHTASYQSGASVAMDDDGDFVVAWHSSDGSGVSWDIYGQRYGASGEAAGGAFRANTHTASAQSVPSVTMDDDGDFLVAWSSGNQDGSGYGAYAQRYGASGEAAGGEFRANTYTTLDQVQASAAMDADGDFLVAWMSSGQDGSGYGVYAQRYRNNFAPTTSDIADKTIAENTATGAISFTIGDAESDADSLTLSATSDNQALVPDANIAVGGSGAERTVTVSPADNQSGTATITVAVNDGSARATDTFTLTVQEDATAPTLIEDSLTPAPNTVAPRNSSVEATFSERMNPQTITPSTFKLYVYNKKKKKWQPINDVRVSCDSECQTATLDPYPSDDTRLLAANKKYKAVITTGIEDRADNALAQGTVWTFTTGAT